MVKQKHVCVIGAGVAGLAAAKAFTAQGHLVTVVERQNDIGGVWEPARSYPDVQTQSPKELYRYTDRPMPADYPEWPTGPQVYDYLYEYARANGLLSLIRLNTSVVSMARRASGAKGWSLQVSGLDNTITTEEFDFVAVCTGQFTDRQALPLPGEKAFTDAGGKILHSAEHTDTAAVKGKNVVVLGGSKSATDIAVHAVKSGASSVTMVYREPVWRIPYFIGGLVNFKRILYIRAQEEMFKGWNLSRKSRISHAIAKPFIWANWRALESLLKLQLKLKKCDMVPTTRIEDGVSCAVPIATPGFYPMVADGRIKAIRGSFASYDTGAVVTTNGTRISTDIAVLAIGFKSGVPFLPEAYRRKLVEDDGQYRLYRVIANPDLPDMGFVGFNSSFCTVLSAELAANWLVRYADGQLANQPNAAAMQSNIDMMLNFRRVERPAAATYGGLCIAPFHFKHFDELMDDIGVTTKRRGALTEKFTPPDADAYGRYLATAPAYQVTPAT
jgi:dimethylaniline monooxygenase (N-oxide forming)